MIRTSTVVYLVLLLGLLAAYFYLRNRQPTTDIELTEEPGTEAVVAYLFAAEQGTPSGIRIQAETGGIVEVARDAENAWALKEPVEAKANPGAAEAAASQITTMRVLDTLSEVDAEVVGLDSPAYTLTVAFSELAEQSVDIGDLTPTQSGYYVRDASGRVMIVSRSSVDALIALLDNPPYLETPTPEPAGTAGTAVPATTATP